jgi:hypothetical protein
MARSVKRGIAAITIAVALSTLGPATSSYFAYSGFRTPPSLGGMSVAYKTAIVPDWLTEITARQALNQESMAAAEVRFKSAEAPI